MYLPSIVFMPVDYFIISVLPVWDCLSDPSHCGDQAEAKNEEDDHRINGSNLEGHPGQADDGHETQSNHCPQESMFGNRVGDFR